MKVKVIEDDCAGCGACEDICPEVFEVVDGGVKVKVAPVPPELREAAKEAADSCPTEAIVIEED